MAILGTSGNDTLTGTSANNTFDLTAGGKDNASGLAGNDIFNLGSTFAAGDVINGGTGNDTISLSGDYGDGLFITGAMMTSVEKLKLGAGNDYALTLDNNAVTIGHSLQVDGSALLAGDVLLFDGTAETTSTFVVTGGAANDVIYGGAALDLFDLSHGGQDTVNGGAGNDVFVFGGAYNNDNVDGGSGDDVLVLDGDYSGAKAAFFGGDGYASIERIVLSDGHDYKLIVGDDGIPPGGRLAIDAGSLLGGDTVSLDITDVDGGTVAGARVKFFGGAGNDTVFVGGGLVTADRLDGGGGANTLAFADDTTVVFKNATVQNFTTLTFGAGADYNITTAGHLAGIGITLDVDGTLLGAADSLTFDGGREKTGQFAFTGGAGDDNFTGGIGNDTFDLTAGGVDTAKGGKGDNTFVMGDTLTAADRIDGGSSSGHNVMVLNGDYGLLGVMAFSATTIANINEIDLLGDHFYSLRLDPSNLLIDQTLTVDASQVAVGRSVSFSAANALGLLTWVGHDGIDSVIGAARGTTMSGFGGNDMFISGNARGIGDVVFDGGSGDDTVAFSDPSLLRASDKIDGGVGANDVLELQGDYATGVTFNATTVLNIETIKFDPELFGGAAQYKLTTNDATVAAGQTLKVDASALVHASDTLNFNGSVETDGKFLVLGTAGADVIKGGAGADAFWGLLGADVMTGGAGADTYRYTQNADSQGSQYDTITDLSFTSDRFDVNLAVTTIESALTGVQLNSGIGFDSSMQTAMSGHLNGAGHAILVTAGSGSLSGHTFLVVDFSSTTGYQGNELVVDVTGYSGTLATGFFI